MFRFIFGVVFAVLVFVVPTSQAATPASGSIEESAGESSFADKFAIGLYGWTYSNGLGKWDGRKATHDGSNGDPVEIVNQVSLMYPSGMGLDFVVMPQFKVRPLLSTPDKGTFELMDPTVGLVGTVYTSGGFSWWARFDNAIPVSTGSRKDGLVLNPGAVNSIAYRFPRSNWEVQTVLVPSVSIFDNGETKSFLYASPRLNYIFNSAWTVFGILEAATEAKRGTGLHFVSASPTNIGAGFKYSFSGLFVQPFVNVYPFGKINDASTYIGMFFGGKLL